MNRNRFSAVATISVPTLGIKGKKITKKERYLETIDPAPATPAGEPLGEIEVEVTAEVAERLKLGWSVEVAKSDDEVVPSNETAAPLLLETTYPTELPAKTNETPIPLTTPPNLNFLTGPFNGPRVFSSPHCLVKNDVSTLSKKLTPSSPLLLSTTHPVPLPAKAETKDASSEQNLATNNEDNNILEAVEKSPSVSVPDPIPVKKEAASVDSPPETSPQSSESITTAQIGLIASALLKKAAQEQSLSAAEKIVEPLNTADAPSTHPIQSGNTPVAEILTEQEEEPTSLEESNHPPSKPSPTEDINLVKDKSLPAPATQPLLTTEESQAIESKIEVKEVPTEQKLSTDNEENDTFEVAEISPNIPERSRDIPDPEPAPAQEEAAPEEVSPETSPQSSDRISTAQIGLIANALFKKAAQEKSHSTTREAVGPLDPAIVPAEQPELSDGIPVAEISILRKEEETSPKKSNHPTAPAEDKNVPAPLAQPLLTTEESQATESKIKDQEEPSSTSNLQSPSTPALPIEKEPSDEASPAQATPSRDVPVSSPIVAQDTKVHSPSSQAAPLESSPQLEDKIAPAPSAQPLLTNEEEPSPVAPHTTSTASSPTETQVSGDLSSESEEDRPIDRSIKGRVPTFSASFLPKNTRPPEYSTVDDDTPIAPPPPHSVTSRLNGKSQQIP